MDGKALGVTMCSSSGCGGVSNEEVYLKAYESVSQARDGLTRYFEFYNGRRPHSSLDEMTPEQFYFNAQHNPGGVNPTAGIHLGDRVGVL